MLNKFCHDITLRSSPWRAGKCHWCSPAWSFGKNTDVTPNVVYKNLQNIICFHQLRFLRPNTTQNLFGKTHWSQSVPTTPDALHHRRVLTGVLWSCSYFKTLAGSGSPSWVHRLLPPLLALLYLVHGLCSHCLAVWTQPLSFHWNFLPSVLSQSFSQIHTCL